MKFLQVVLLAIASQITVVAAEPAASSSDVSYVDTLMALYVNHKTNNTANDIPVLINFFAHNKPEVAQEYEPVKNKDFKGKIQDILDYHTIICDTAHQIQLLGLDKLLGKGFDLEKLCQILLEGQRRLQERKENGRPEPTTNKPCSEGCDESKKPKKTG